jgi:hypothetical protein
MRSFFDQVQAVLAGTARLPLDAGGTKLLHFMLERNEGCDVTMMPDTFHIQYGWHLAYHQYTHELAPRVVSWLCDAAPAGYLPAGSLPWWFETPAGSTRESRVHDGGKTVVRSAPLEPYWTYGPRRLWFERSPGRVVIMIRDATIDPGASAVPPPIEPPIEYITGQHPCPHCGVVPERYRKLRGGGLVCLACGRSSA